MKIAIVTEVINYHSGARAPLEIAKHLAKRNHTVTVYAYDYWQDQDTRNDMVRNGISIVTLKTGPIPLIGKYITALSLFRLIKKSQTQAIAFAGTLPFFLGSLLTHLPIVLMYHGAQPNAYLEKKNPDEQITTKDKLLNQIANFYIYLVNGILVYLSKEVIAISNFAAKEAEHLYHKKENSIIYLGTSSFSSNNQVAKKEKNSVAILSVSRITPYKGFHIILEAIKKIKTKKNIVLTIAGSQPKMNYVRYLKQLGNNQVQIILDPSDTELAKLYQHADFCVTADRYLYFGLSIYEAAFFGKPTISLNNAAASEIIDHGKTGLIARTSEELELYIKNLSENPLLRKKLGISARKRALQFTWEKCAREWEKELLKYVKQPL